MCKKKVSDSSESKVVTLGCRLNIYESEKISLILKEKKLNDTIVFNTCAVTAEAEKKSVQAIKRAIRDNPQKKIIVTGCASNINKDKFTSISGVNLVIDNENKTNHAAYDAIAIEQKSSIMDYLTSPEQQIIGEDFDSNSTSWQPQTQLKIPHQKNTKQLVNLKNNDELQSNEKHGLGNPEYHINKQNNIEQLDIRHSTRESIPADIKHNMETILHDNNLQTANPTFTKNKLADSFQITNNKTTEDKSPQSENSIATLEGRTRAFVQVQNGCDHRCTFCIIPYGRGPSRSVPPEDVINEVRKLVENGYKELVLTGVDMTDYGKNFSDPLNLGGLCKKILSNVPSLPRLRLSSIDVAEIDNNLLDLIANESRFMPHLHISLQSGDDLILKRMKRRHNRKNVLDFCSLARKLRPEIAFGSDIIAGFPTENDAMFLNTKTLLEEANIVFNHIFTYSSRIETPAARMPQVPLEIRKKRSAELISLTSNLTAELLTQMVNTVQKIIVESENSGRAENFAIVRFKDGHNHLKGEIVSSRILTVENEAIVAE